jgi:hypothetical protein
MSDKPRFLVLPDPSNPFTLDRLVDAWKRASHDGFFLPLKTEGLEEFGLSDEMEIQLTSVAYVGAHPMALHLTNRIEVFGHLRFGKDDKTATYVRGSIPIDLSQEKTYLEPVN